jgi:hypothetical protein
VIYQGGDLNNIVLPVPVSFVFWGIIAVYAFHILEESTLGDIFVNKVKRDYWTDYSWTKFFGFNTLLIILNVAAVILFDVFGGAWIIFPMSLALERTFNGIYHLGETILKHRFSSGLLSSVLTWILIYILIKYYVAAGQVPLLYFIISSAIGLVISCAMIGVLVAGPFSRKRVR